MVGVSGGAYGLASFGSWSVWFVPVPCFVPLVISSLSAAICALHVLCVSCHNISGLMCACCLPSPCPSVACQQMVA